MNRRKIIGSVESFISACFKASIPVKLIAEAVKINPATINKFLKLQKLPKELKEFKPNSLELKLHLLKIYAWLVSDPIDIAAALGPESSLLRRPIHKYLKLNEWETYLNGVVTHHVRSAKHDFTEDVSEGYQKIINDILPPVYLDADGAGLLEQFLTKAHKSDPSLFPNEVEIKSIQRSLDKCITMFFSKEEKGLKITSKVVEYINALLCEMSVKEKDFILSKYGVESSPAEVALKYDVSVERIRQISQRTIRRLTKVIAKQLGLINLESLLNIQEEKKNLELRLEELNKEKRGLESQLIIMNEHSYNVIAYIKKERQGIPEATLNFFKANDAFRDQLDLPTLLNNKNLFLPLEDLDLSVRAYRILKWTMKFNFLWQVCETDLDTFHKQRNFGQKTADEIEFLLHEKDLSLGMIFGQNRPLLIATTGE